jgi:hypothetical protein
MSLPTGKDQTVISLIERSQRRVDVLEFHRERDWAGALYSRVVGRLPQHITILLHDATPIAWSALSVLDAFGFSDTEKLLR